MHTIVLIGYRCTGKTSVAQQLGKRLGLPVADTDAVITQQTGKSIAEIFAESGENGFRDIEESVVAAVLNDAQRDGNAFILSTGGGVVLRQTNRQRLRNAGKVYWLTAMPETIAERLKADVQSQQQRPGLTGLPPLDEIKTLLQERNPLYAETAHKTIASDNLTPVEIAGQIAEEAVPVISALLD
ncbi:MAG: shikimate kinase [Planctomycetaceae bacterium]|jgi:shikimate kinase|nr:shikimate kinase [Planctomycetaceae bacterium]